MHACMKDGEPGCGGVFVWGGWTKDGGARLGMAGSVPVVVIAVVCTDLEFPQQEVGQEADVALARLGRLDARV